MKFNKIVRAILEGTTSAIPAFDDDIEVYTVYFHDPRTDYYRTSHRRTYSNIERVRGDDLEMLDIDNDFKYWYVQHRGHNFERALQILSNCYLDNYKVSVPEEALEMIRNKLGHLFGEWVIIDNSKKGVEYNKSGSMELVVIVDIAGTRSQQINKGLEDVDTTGFEDLL